MRSTDYISKGTAVARLYIDRYFLDMEVKAWWLINLQRWYVFFYEKNGRRVRGVLGKDRTRDLLRSIL